MDSGAAKLWAELEFLGHKAVVALQETFGTVQHFANSFDGEAEVLAVLSQVLPDQGVRPYDGTTARRVEEWKQRASGIFKRARLAKHAHLQYNLNPCESPVFPSSYAEEFENIVKDDPRYALSVVKKTVKQRKASMANTRADQENMDRDKYALELAWYIQEACLPASLQIATLDEPAKGWKRVFGGRRSKTLRNRVRAWSKFRNWLIGYNGNVWPKAISELIGYVEEMIKSGCAKTLPGELQAALVVLEQAGRVPEGAQLSRDGLWLAHLSSWQNELRGKVVSRGSAPPYTVAILLALEMMVMNIDLVFYKRVIAFVTLLATWACMRLDDVQNVLPETMRLSTRGLTVRMARTKTTGPDKVHGQIHAFVARKISLTGADWIYEGVQLFKHESGEYPRDYLVPAPNDNWTGFKKKLVEPPQLSNYIRSVLRLLGTPKFQDGEWRVNEVMELVPDMLSLFWSGHSPRHFMPQASAAIGCSKTDRDFLGRWAIGRVGSNAYLLTSRQIVERVQMQVMDSLFEDATSMYDENEILDDVKEFSNEKGLIGHRTRRRHTTLPLRRVGSVVTGLDEVSDSEILEDDREETLKAEALVQTVSGDDSDDGFFVTISRRTGYRRLHMRGVCHVHAERCQQVEWVSSVEKATFDTICKVCGLRLQEEAGEEESQSSSGSDAESSSTSVATTVQEQDCEL